MSTTQLYKAVTTKEVKKSLLRIMEVELRLLDAMLDEWLYFDGYVHKSNGDEYAQIILDKVNEKIVYKRNLKSYNLCTVNTLKKCIDEIPEHLIDVKYLCTRESVDEIKSWDKNKIIESDVGVCYKILDTNKFIEYTKERRAIRNSKIAKTRI